MEKKIKKQKSSKKRGNREGTVYQRSDGRWVGQVTFGYRPDGTVDRRTISGKVREKVAQQVAEWTSMAFNGITPPEPTDLTVEEFIRDWAKNHKMIQVASRTYDWYLNLIHVHIIPGIGKIKLNKLTADNIQALLNKMSKQGLGKSMIAGVQMTLNQALKHAVRTKLIATNPVEYTDLPKENRSKKISAEKKDGKAIPIEVRQTILKAALGERLYLVIILLMFTGMRIGEVLALPWKNIDFEKSTICIDRAISTESTYDEDGKRLGRETIITEPKTTASLRTIKVPKIVIKALSDWKDYLLNLKRTKSCPWTTNEELTAPDAPVIISTRTWGNYTYGGFRSSFNSFLKRHGLDVYDITPHRFRHTFATILLEKGVSPRVVQEILGHAKIVTTLGTYSHVVQELFDGVADMLDVVHSDMCAGSYAPDRYVSDEEVALVVPDISDDF